MPSQKPPDLDENFQPVGKPPDLDDNFQPVKVGPQVITEPTTFGEGFKQSLMGGEALQAGFRGAGGFLQGAIADLPSSIYGGLKTVGSAITDPTTTLPQVYEGMKGFPARFMETTKMAGSKPEEFGRMMGQLTGQPLVTAGVVKGAPPVIRGVPKAAGAVIEPTGRIMRRYQPVSGMLPRLAEGRTLRNIERGVGGGLEKIGQRMRGKSEKVPKAAAPNELTSADFEKYLKEQLGPSPRKPGVTKITPSTGTKAKSTKIEPIPQDFFERMAPKNVTSETKPTFEPLSNVPEGTDFLRNMVNDVGAKSEIRTKASNLLNRVDKGEISPQQAEQLFFSDVDANIARAKFTVTSTTERPAPKPRTIENAPPNQRARIYRGQNDPVDVFFADPNSRDIFGAGQSIFKGGVTVPKRVQRFEETVKRVVEKYGMDEKKARTAIRAYNERIRKDTAGITKQGEGLYHNAPSFEDFIKPGKTTTTESHIPPMMGARGEKKEAPIEEPIMEESISNLPTMDKVETRSESPYEDIIARAAAEHDIDPDMLRRIISTESAGKTSARSHKGAQGLMQLMPETARELGVTDPFDPEQNIMGGARYFRQLLDRFKDPRLALAAYNAGPGNVAKYGGVPPFPETQAYVNKIFPRR